MTHLVDQFDDKIGYRFTNARLLEDALTHRSAGSNNNERLEFLGDGLLNFIIAAELYHRFPRATEGELSRLRASLVKGETLAGMARSIDLGPHLTLGPGEMKSGGFRRTSILADALEAVIGAVYLDGGLERCWEVVSSLFQEALAEVTLTAELKDPKTRLQEHLQSRRMPLPEYNVVSVHGEAHAQTFTVECQVRGLEQSAHGTGSSRRKAEQVAAERALELLGENSR